MSDEAYTIFCRNLAEEVTESILYELFLQAGPLEDVRIPTTDGKNRNYGFIVYKHKCSVKYAIELFQDTKLFGRAIALQNRSLNAEREAELRNRARSWQEDLNYLRGGPSNYSRFNDVNSLRGGSVSANYSRDDAVSSLRGGPISFSRKDDMAPRGYDNPYNQFSSKPDMDPRYINPYASLMGFNMDRNSSRSSDRYDRNSRDYYRNDSIESKNGRESRYDRRDENYGRRDLNHRSERNQENHRRHNSRRSRSRDRSPLNYDRSQRGKHWNR